MMRMGILSMFCVTVVLMCILYVPSTHPPEWFLSELRAEHAANTDFWGSDHATRILLRMLDWSTSDGPIFTGQKTPAASGIVSLGQRQMMAEVQDMTDRIVSNAYFRSVRTLLLLATYRIAELLEWSALGALFLAAALIDGAVRRVVKAKEFRAHNAEVYGAHLMLMVLMACGVLLAIVSPWVIPPAIFALVPFLFALSGSYAIANYHYRGD
jgi:hypothetical protein